MSQGAGGGAEQAGQGEGRAWVAQAGVGVEDAAHAVLVAGQRSEQLELHVGQAVAAPEQVRPVVGVHALRVARALPRAGGPVERGGVVQYAGDGLPEQPPEPYGVPDALRGDRVLEVPGVAGQRPAGARRAAEVRRVLGRADDLRAAHASRQPLGQPGDETHRTVELRLQVPAKVRRPLDRRHQQDQRQPRVAGKGVAQFAAGQPHRGGVAPLRARVLVVGVVAGPPVGVGDARALSAGQAGDGRAAAVGADDEAGADLVLPAPVAVLDAHACDAVVLPQQAGDAVPVPDLRPGLGGGLGQRRVQRGAPDAEAVADPVDRGARAGPPWRGWRPWPTPRSAPRRRRRQPARSSDLPPALTDSCVG